MIQCTFTTMTARDLDTLKQQHVQQLDFPLDGMWECFIDMAEHYSIRCEDKVIGYCVINDEQKLVQFSVTSAHDVRQIFNQIITELKVTGAMASTSEFQYLSLCMDHQKSTIVNALQYHIDQNTKLHKARFPTQTHFRLIEHDELQIAVDFGITTLGADPNWLYSYYEDLIKGEKLFGLWQDTLLIAAGECRPSDTQRPYADVGMVVLDTHRGKGIATNILLNLLQNCKELGLRAICSTESDNIAAQKAIAKAGFISHHRILEVIF